MFSTCKLIKKMSSTCFESSLTHYMCTKQNSFGSFGKLEDPSLFLNAKSMNHALGGPLLRVLFQHDNYSNND